MEVRGGYKQTEVGVIPEDWELIKMGNLLVSSPDYGINAPAIEYDSNYPTYLRITDITDDGNYNSIKKVSINHFLSDNYYLSDNEIVLARTGASVGKSYLYNAQDGPLVFAGFLIRIKPNPNICFSKYLKYYLQTSFYWKWVNINSMRSGQPGINSTEYASLPVALPPKPEQQAIAQALSDTDALIDSLEKLIEKKQRIKQGAMQELLTGKRRLPGFEVKKGYKQTEIGEIPEDWEIKSYGDVFSFLPTATYSRSQLTQHDNVHYLHYGDIHTKYDFTLDMAKSNLPTIPDELVNKYTLLKDGDIVMADASEDYSGICKSVEVTNTDDRKAIAGLHTFLLRDHSDTFVNGFKGYLGSSNILKRQFDQYATGMKVYGVSKQNLKKILIPVPPKLEQKTITTILSDMDSEIEALETKLQKTREIKEGMMHELLTGRIRLI